jgi:hypothetical protein
MQYHISVWSIGGMIHENTEALDLLRAGGLNPGRQIFLDPSRTVQCSHNFL